jgi:hypothetical protein
VAVAAAPEMVYHKQDLVAVVVVVKTTLPFLLEQALPAKARLEATAQDLEAVAVADQALSVVLEEQTLAAPGEMEHLAP